MPRQAAEFRMGIPRESGRETRFAFWMQASDKKLLSAVRALGCVAGAKRSRASGSVLVEISDDHDPDEAWHWIRAELESATHPVKLDKIWAEAVRWIL